MYNNLHSACFGGINSSSWGKFPDRERNNGKEEPPSLYVSSARAGNMTTASCMRQLALHSQAEVARRGHPPVKTLASSYDSFSIISSSSQSLSERKSTLFSLILKALHSPDSSYLITAHSQTQPPPDLASLLIVSRMHYIDANMLAINPRCFHIS